MSSLNWADLAKAAGESSNNYEPLPDGDYDLKVIEAVATVSASGKTMFKLTTEVQGGAYAKRRVWDNLVVSPDNQNALSIFFSKMQALGLPRDWFLNNAPSNAQIESLLNGKMFRAAIGSSVWNGSKRNEIRKYYVAQAATPATPAAQSSMTPPPPPPPPGAPAPSSAPAQAPF